MRWADVASDPTQGKCRKPNYSSYCHREPRRYVMHAFLEAEMGDKPALQPKAAIGPAVRAIARDILAGARAAVVDPERPSGDAVHDFRRAIKQWRALMRLLEPFIPNATGLRRGAREHARSLA